VDIREQLGFAHPVRKKIQDERDPEAGAFDARFPTANRGINRDAIQMRIHGGVAMYFTALQRRQAMPGVESSGQHFESSCQSRDDRPIRSEFH
jgi:hypothetical protein